jgi:hypothetical protein
MAAATSKALLVNSMGLRRAACRYLKGLGNAAMIWTGEKAQTDDYSSHGPKEPNKLRMSEIGG